MPPQLPSPRDLLPFLGACLLLAAGIASGWDRFESSDSPEVLAFPALGPGETAILFGGDTLLTGGTELDNRLKNRGWDWMSRRVLPLIESADAVAFVANQEGPITERTRKGKPKGRTWTYNARKRTLPGLTAARFTHMSLANNHGLDRRLSGLKDSIENLRGVGIVPFGGGDNALEAGTPALIDAGGTRVAILAGMQSKGTLRRAGWAAGETSGGITLLGRADIPGLVSRAKASADLVVAFPHWGENYRPVNSQQVRIAGLLIDAGVDAIVGHGGHSAQSFSHVRDVPVVWGLGNLFFGTPGRFGHDKLQPGYGFLVRMVLKDAAIDRFEIVPISINNRLLDYQPRPCTLWESRHVLERYAKRRGSTVRMVDGVGIFDAAPPVQENQKPGSASPEHDGGH